MKICPKCKSENIHIEITTSVIFGSPQKWKCNDCGFESFIVLEKKIKKNQRIKNE